MSYNELISIYKLLNVNPNIGLLGNKEKIKLIRLISNIKNEINVLIETEKSVFAKYGIKETGSGDYNEGIAALKETDQYNNFINEFNGLHAEQTEIHDKGFFNFTENDLLLLCSNKVVYVEGKQSEFSYTLAEYELLFKYLEN